MKSRSRGRLRLLAIYVLALGVVNAQSPDARWGQASTVFGTTVILHGGKTDPANAFSYTSAPNTDSIISLNLDSAFDLTTPPWTTLSSTGGSSSAPSVSFHTVTAFSQTELLYFGGDPGWEVALSTRNDSAGTLWLSDQSATWTNRPEGWASQPTRRRGHSAASWGGRVYITGGESVDGSGGFTTPYSFDPWAGRFAALNSDGAPDVVGHVSFTLPNGTLLVLGGYSNSQQALVPLDTIYTYSIQDNAWSSFATNGETVPGGRRNFVAVSIGENQFLIQGGSDAIQQNGIADGFILDLNSREWSSVPALADGVGARWDHAAFAVGPLVFFTCGYTASGPASNQLLLFDTSTSQFLSSFTPAEQPSWANTNSPIIYPPPPTDNGGNGDSGDNIESGENGENGDNGEHNSGSNPNPGNPGDTQGNQPTHPSQPTQLPPEASNPPTEEKKPSIGAVLGGVFGGLAAAALVVVLVVYRRRRKAHRRAWSGYTDESEKAQMVSGFTPLPHSKPYAIVTRLLHIRPQTRYAPAPRRERFDMLADEDTEYDYGTVGTGVGRKRTNGSGSSYTPGRWSLGAGGTLGSFGGLVNASVSSFRSAFGMGTMNNVAPPPPSRESTGHSRREYISAGISAKSLPAPPTAWRRGSSYTSNNISGNQSSVHDATPSADPFGDEYGVEEEYQKAMEMQHEMLRRAGTSGVDDYSALVLGRRPEIGRRPSEGPPVTSPTPGYGGYGSMVGVPLAPVESISDPSTSHAHLVSHESLAEPSTVTHATSLRTLADNGRYAFSPPPVYSPPLYGQGLQRATSTGSRIGASLSRTMSAISSLFSGGHGEYAGRGRTGGKNYGVGGYEVYGGGGYDYLDLRDPNPPPPALGAGLIPIEESGTENNSQNPSKIITPSEGAFSLHSPDRSASGRPALVLKPLHEKSLSSLKTANSEALERLGLGGWDVVQRIGTTSSRHTEGTTGSSQLTDLRGDDDHRWSDAVMPKQHVGFTDSPAQVTDSSREAFWGQQPPVPVKASTQPLSTDTKAIDRPIPSTSAPSPNGPRPIPPPKKVSHNLAARIDALGLGKEPPMVESPTSLSPPGRVMSPPGRTNTETLYGLAPKPTLFIANPGTRETSGSSG